MKTFFVLALLSFSVVTQAFESYPLQFGIGTDSCHPNKDGLKECVSYSPSTVEILVPLEIVPDGNMVSGFHSKSGVFEKIGYSVAVKITTFPGLNIDDMLTLNVTTWDLAKPEVKREVSVEVFTLGPKNLGRVNLPGLAIGSEDDYSNIILSIRKSFL